MGSSSLGESPADLAQSQTVAAWHAVHQARRSVIAAWASVALNILVVTAAVVMPYYQTKTSRRDAQFKATAERRLLLAELSRILNSHVLLALKIGGDGTPGARSVTASELRLGANEVQNSIDRIGLIETRFALEADYFAATSQARAALMKMRAALLSGAAQVGTRPVMNDGRIAWISDFISGFSNLAILAERNPLSDPQAGSVPLRVAPCSEDQELCDVVVERFGLEQAPFNEYDPGTMKAYISRRDPAAPGYRG